MAATPQMVIRVAGNVEELRRNLAEGKNQIETTTAAMQKLAASFSGDKLIQAAHNVTAAIAEIGGVSKLTAAEQERVNAIIEKALDKYKALGKDAPPGMKELAEATRTNKGAWDDFVKGFNVQDAVTSPLGTAKAAAMALAESIGGTALAAAGAVAAIVAVAGAVFTLAKNAAESGARLGDMSDKTGMSVPALSRLKNALDVTGGSMDQMTDVVFELQKRMGENSESFRKGLEQMGLSTEKLKEAGPDRYLELLTQGLNSLEEPHKRAAAGSDVLGKKYKEVAASLQDLAAGYEKTKDIVPWSKEQADAAEKFDQDLKSITVHAKAWAEAIGRDLIPPLSTFLGFLTDIAGPIASVGAGLVGVTGVVNFLSEAWGLGTAAVRTFRGEAETTQGVTGESTKSVDKWRKSIEDMTPHLEKEKELLGHAALAELTLTQSAEELIRVRLEQKAAEELLFKTRIDGYKVTMALDDQAMKKLEALNADRFKGIMDTDAKIREIDRQTHDLRMKAALDSTSYQINKIWERVAAEERAFKGSEEQRKRYNDAIEALALEEINVIQDAADAAYEASARLAEKSVAKVKDNFNEATDALHEFVGTLNTIISGNPFLGPNGDSVAATLFGNFTASEAAFIAAGGFINSTIGGNRRQMGGPVSAGEAYIVGERRPELFVPDRPGMVLPSLGGGVVFNTAVHLTGAIVGTQRELAKFIGEAHIASLRQSGTRLPIRL